MTTVKQPEMDSEPVGSNVEGNTEVEIGESVSEEVGGPIYQSSSLSPL